MRHQLSKMTGLAVMLLLVSACGSSGVGDIFGGGSDVQTNVLRGTVDYVDANNRTIVLRNVSGYNSMLSNSGSGSTVRVQYDNQTEVQYQGQDYRPTDLESGDEVEVRVNESGSQLVADKVVVVRDVSGASGGSSTYPGYGTTLRGTVRYIDANRRTIELDRGNGATTFVEYDNALNVSWNGGTYRVTDLERGDEIEVRASDLGSNRFRADSITVVRSVSSNNNGTWNSGSMANLRGTVRYVDTTRRTIELEQVSGLSGFNTGAGTIVVSYGSNASVEFGGQSHPVTGLERGDVIEVQADRNGSTYVANRIYLVRNIRN